MALITSVRKSKFLLSFALAILCASQAHADSSDGIPLRGFTDFSYIYENADASNSFRIGDFDLFLAKPLDKRVNILVELNFQPSFHDIGADLERSYVQYVVGPWLKIAAGRYHTAIGYWNDTYHHGSYLQTSVSRPVMERFEDDGGLLPTHTTGLEFRGNGLVRRGNLGYIIDIGNSRGPVKDPPTFYYSYTKGKSVSSVVYYEMDNGLRLGASVFHSDLPGGAQRDGDGTPLVDSSGTAVVGPSGHEWIYGGHVVYNSPSIEWLTEYNHMTHDYTNGSANSDGSTTSQINMLYSQLGIHIGRLTPYVRYEIDATNHPDAYLNTSTGAFNPGLLATTRYYTAGARYELTQTSALKFELNCISAGAPIAQQFNVGTGDSTTDWTTNLNWSIGF